MTNEILNKKFIKLANNGALNHSYLLFGEGNKLDFALSFANFLEKGSFELPQGILTECLIVKPTIEETTESLGIDSIRSLQNFLYNKPISSKYRIAIITGVEYMTEIAENALLKIAEEPPEHAVIILIANNAEIVGPTLRSRFQKIFFPRGPKLDFESRWDHIPLRDKTALKKELLELANPENRDKIEPFLTELLRELSKDPVKNVPALKSLLKTLSNLKDWNVNKKIQLEALAEGLRS